MRSTPLKSLVLLLLFGAAWSSLAAAEPPLENFIRREGDVLKDGEKTYRFLSLNIPNLHYVEDDMRFDQPMPFRLPDRFEIDDAMETVRQMGGRVVRMYALSVRKSDDPPGMPRHILGPGKYDEEAFKTLDEVLASANRHGVRVIVPLIDQWVWWGGIGELASFRGKNAGDFWTDPQLIEDYKNLAANVINRKNTVTGVRYRDDKAILAWETGNELRSPAEWTRQAAAYIKSVDPNHLVIDGAQRELLTAEALEIPGVDFVQTHHYEKDPRAMIEHVIWNRKLSRGKKPYHLGEFGFLGTEALAAVMDAVIEQGLSGALLWSLRPHSRDGGFYWHHEPLGGDFFKAYHWPGFASGERYDERRVLGLLRGKAFQIQGREPPPLSPPAPPRLLSVDPGGQLSWQGSAGAEGYDIERAKAPEEKWTVVGSEVSDAGVQYRPLFSDESARPGKTYYYRVVARNGAGVSKPSNVVGPAKIDHRTLVDEMDNESRIFFKEGKFRLVENHTRKYKEDCHRLAGTPKSFLIYYLPDGIDAVRIFFFTASGKPAVDISFSKDGRRFERAAPQAAATATFGESAYGYAKATRYSAQPPGRGYNYVKTEFLTDAQISRIEIDHGRVER